MRSELTLPPCAINKDALCILNISPFVFSPFRPMQRLVVSVNGINIAEFDIDRVGKITFIIPKGVLSDTEENVFDFYHPDAAKPIDFGGSQDFRVLSISFHRMEIIEWDAPPDQNLTPDIDRIFGWDLLQRDAEPSAHLEYGWYERSKTDIPGLWLANGQSDINLPSFPKDSSGTIKLDLTPSLVSPYRTVQRLKLILNNAELSRFDISGRESIVVQIPAGALIENGRNRLILQHPDHFVPDDVLGNADRRSVSFFVHGMTIEIFKNTNSVSLPNISLKELFFHFESIGNNCEFGNVQRRAGAEPLGLFRWSFTRIENIISGLESKFAGVGDIDEIEVEISSAFRDGPREYMIRDKKNNLFYHTWNYEGQIDPDKLKNREARRLKFLARKFLEDLQAGEKILVYQHHPRVSDNEVDALLQAVRKIGENPILVVELTEDKSKVGGVDKIGNGLFRGYLDHFTSPNNPYSLSYDAWVKLCSNLYFNELKK